MPVAHAILGLLSHRPLSGYDLKKKFADSLALPWSGNSNQIYTTLIKLHRDGLVTRVQEDPEKGPARKVYTITAAGKTELKRWVLGHPEPAQLRHPLLVQLAWADQLDGSELDRLLAEYAEDVTMQLMMLQAQHPHWDRDTRGDAYLPLAEARSARERFLWTAVVEHGIAFCENELRWIETTRRALRAKHFPANRRLLG